MDRNIQRRSTVSVQSTAPSSLRHCSFPSSSNTSPPTDTASLKPEPKLKRRSAPPKPLALARVKGTVAMDSSPQMNSEMSWLNDASPMSMTPRTATPRTPQRSGAGTPEPVPPSLVNPSSALLQDLLKEQRANRVPKGTASEDAGQGAPRTPERSHSRPQSRSQSPAQSQSQSRSQSQEEVGSEKQRKIQTALSSGLRQPHEMGVREMGEYVSKINKQNFDLKLEIFHRVQQMAALEKKLQRMEQLEEELERLRGLEDEVQELRDAESDNQRLRESNEQLRHEVDKRDQAITEAVDMICLLENKVAQLEAGENPSTPSTTRGFEDDDPGATTPRQNTAFAAIDIPERTSSWRGTSRSKHRRSSSDSHQLKRAPSLLSDHKSPTTLQTTSSTADDRSRSALSDMTKSESLQSMSDFLEPESPRLSALSECSELYPHEEEASDRLDIPVKERDSSGVSEAPKGTVEDSASKSLIESWIQPQRDAFLEDVPEQDILPSNLLRQTGKPSFDSDSYNSSSQKTRVDSVFGGSRLPPTPDTMSTAYATGPNRSNGSIVAEKSLVDQAMTAGHGRPRSAGQLTTRRNSTNSAAVGSVDMNVSDVTSHRPDTDEEEESPTFFPLNSLTSRDKRLYCPETLDKKSLGYIGQNAFLNGEGLDRVLSKLDNSYYGSMAQDESDSSLSSSPPLTPQDWVEASKPDAKRRRDKSAMMPVVPKSKNTRPQETRITSQSSFIGRRHSIDSTIRDSDVPMIPTLDIQSLESGLQPGPELDRRMIGRKISIRPPFFARSAPPRRLQPSLMFDGSDSDDGAPAPIIRKARDDNPAKPTKTVSKAESHSSSFSASVPMPADAKRGDIHRTLPHSFTETGFMNNAVAKPPQLDPRDHKRRSSLGIFSWVKGASGLGKKPEPELPVKASAPSTALVKSRPPRATPESGKSASDSGRTIEMGAMKVAIDDIASKSKHSNHDEETGRRPRYMDRRARRG
ncbi:uncharacterized protein AtWU_02957 [Aspergillus tubingensis]|uniref:uncharacterized protein n=1 Tax=Aspergillus tubingensis TaxID=5068 RepID=UPI001579BDE9|nr:DNA replication complex GINS protein psf3 [Aspergillus tubingensis]GFN13159.1 DNA replication complex GINS protein psf3 [Aspergillus tubingensis]GLA95830.1 hypothetical protein AtubIFM57143_002851 [Aspergillus tubingensis]